MKLMVAVFDKAAEYYMQPFFVRAQGEALRAFMDECAREGSQFKDHPEHYDLYQLGEFDDLSGAVEGKFPPVLLLHGSSAISNSN